MKKIYLILFCAILSIFGLNKSTQAQYCYPTYANLCSSDDFINNFSTTGGTTNITNNNSGCCGTINNYIYYNTMSVTVSPGGSFNISVQSGSTYEQGFAIWIDYNNDGDFADAGEAVWNSSTYGTQVFTGTINVSGSVSQGYKRLRVVDCYYAVPADPCGSYGYGECEDYNLVVVVPGPMYYASSTTTQNTNFVTPGTLNAQIIGVQVVTSGSLNPVNTTSITFNTTGTTNVADITNAKVFYTGYTGTFSTGTQFGSTVASPSGTFTVTGTATLSIGTNYFWLSYDVAAGATLGSQLDAQCTSITVADTARTPTVTAPAGFRQILVPLCGIYTINPSLPASITNFISFASAKSTLESLGVSCPVIFNVAAGTYNEQLSWGVTPIPNISATNNVTFQSANGDSTSVIIQVNTSTNNYVIEMNAASYLTWKNMTFKADPAGSTGRVINFKGGSHHIQFLNNRIIGISAGSTSNTYALVYNDNTSNDNYNTFSYNRFENGSYGFYWYGMSSASLEQGNIISYNNFVNTYYYGMYLYYQDGSSVIGNTIAPTSPYSTFYGIYTAYNQNQSIIAGNKVSLPSTGYCITKYYCTGTAALPGLVYNNFASIGGTSTSYGIRAYYSPYNYYYHNSINVYSSYTSGYGVYLYGTAPLNVVFKNNIIANTGAGYAFYVSGATGWVSDYNDIYAAGTNLGYFGGAVTSFPAWQTATGQDANSFNVNPVYFSNTDLHTYNGTCNNAGTPITAVTTDIDGEARSTTTPDIGADEYTPPPMYYSSCTSSQPNTSFVLQGSNNNGILLANIVTTGVLSPVEVSAFTFTTSGSTNASGDITNAKLYYTGSSTTLSTANLVGTESYPDGLFYIYPSSPIPLEFGNNYFWLTYDIPVTSTIDNVVDAQFLSATVDDTLRTPTVTSPAGNRIIAAPLCGTYTINPLLPASTTNFTSFTNAYNSLLAVGVSCPVIFNVAAGTYNEQITYSSIPGISATNTITFQSANGDSSSVIIMVNTSTTNNFVIKMNAASYLTFKKMSFKVDPASSVGRVIEITGGSHHIQFLNNRIIGLSAGSTANTFTLVFSDNSFNDNNNTFSYNRFENGSYGFYWYGVSSSSLEQGTVISYNNFVNTYYYGMYVYYQDGSAVIGNTIAPTSPYSTFYGIYTAYNQNQSIIAGNKVSLPSTGYCITKYYCTGTASQPGLVYNNFASIGGSSTAYGIRAYSSPYNYYYYNSVNVYSTYTTGYGVYLYGSSPLNVEFKNNVIANQGGGYVFYASSAYTGAVSNYNNLYGTGTNFGYWGGAVANFAAWQSASGQDLNSVSAPPFFLTNSDLHTFSAAMNGAATPITGITTDIDGDTRNTTTPDIGADEFTPAPMTYYSSTAYQASTSNVIQGFTDAQILRIEVNTNGSLNPLVVSNMYFKTSGTTSTSDLTAAKVYYTGSSNTFSTATMVGAAISNPNGSFTISGSQTLMPYTNYFWLVYDIDVYAVVGNVVDAVFDSLIVTGTTYTPLISDPAGNRTIIAGMCGTYTIDPSLPASSTNYLSFTAAVTDLVNIGISCPVVFNVAPGTYTEQVDITEVLGTTAIKTVTFQSATLDADDVILQYNNTTSTLYFVFRMSGADYIRLNYLTVTSTNTGYARLIALRDGANGNQVTNCHLICPVVYSTSDYWTAIYDFSASIDNNNTFSGNLIENGSYGIYAYGSGASVLESGNIISGNTINNTYYRGIYTYYQDNCQIYGNTINAGAYTSFYGIYMAYNQNGSIVTGNSISLPNGGYALYRYYCTGNASNRGKVYNNFISVAGSTAYGLDIYYSNYQDVCYNSVNVYGTSTTSRAAYLYGSSTAIYDNAYKNNLYVNHAGGYAVYRYYQTGSVSDYNDYYSTGANLCYYNVANISNLAAWQTVSGSDQHSFSVEPYYTSNTDLHTSTGMLNGLATPIAGITTDIDGEIRDALTPDPGADEFIPAACDAWLQEMISPAGACGNDQEPVIVQIKNIGSTAIDPGDLTLTYVVNNGTPVIDTIDITILPGLTGNFTFTTPVNMLATSTDLYFDFEIYTTFTCDVQYNNDTIQVDNVYSGFIPNEPTVYNDTIPYNTAATLLADDVPGATFYWYDSPTSNLWIAMGDSSFVTPVLYDTTCYYVELATTTMADIVVGEGTTTLSTTYCNPYGQYFTSNKSQFLITAAELTAAGIGAGPINALSFNVITPTNPTSQGANLNNFTIQMRETSLTYLSTSNYPTSGFTTVFTAPNFPTVTGWNLHTFSTAFAWDGTSNIIVQTCFSNYVSGSNYSTNATLYATTTPYGSCVGYYTDASYNCTMYSFSYSSSLRPNMKFHAMTTGCHSDRVPVCAVVTGIPANDAGCTDILEPVSGFELTNSEHVKVKLINWGTSPISNYSITYEVIETGLQVTELLQNTVYSGSSLIHTFNTPADLSTYGTYHIIAYTSIYGDTYYSNDTAYATIVNAPVVYCNATYTNACTTYYINNFSTSGGFTNIVNNGSGCNGNTGSYIYYPNQTLMVNPGQTINLSMQGGSSAIGFRVWADWNHNGAFTDAGENIFNSIIWGTQVFTGSFTVPANATPGTQRLRVRSQNAAVPADPCVVYSYGETEDYNVMVIPIVQTDAGLTAILQPAGSAPEGTVSDVAVVIINTGLLPLTSLQVSYSVNSLIQDTASWTGNLAFMETDTVIIPGMVIPAGSYSICANVIYSLDSIPQNNQICSTGFGFVTMSLPYYDDFDGAVNYWYAGPSTNGTQWQLGNPTYSNASYPVSPLGPLSTPNAWDVNLTTVYSNSASCMLYSPYFSFSGISNASVEFWRIHNTQINYDGVRIEYTTNGSTWLTLGIYNDPTGTNWYNSSTISSSGKPGWSGSSSGWIKSTLNLSLFDSLPFLQFRFVFNSDASTVYSSFSIDNFLIHVPQPYDAGVTAILQPTGTQVQNMTTVPIQVTIKNFGFENIDTMQIAFTVNGGIPVVSDWYGLLTPNSTTNVTLTGFAPPLYGDNELCVYTILEGDTVANYNDTTCQTYWASAQYDLGIISIDAPENGCDLTYEDVIITFHNFGDIIFGSLPVSYQLGTGPLVYETINDTIYPDTNYTYTFTTQVNLTATIETTYTFYASVNYPADPVLANNQANTQIISGVTPADPAVNNVTVWSGEAATLSVNNPSPAVTYSWWDAPNGNIIDWDTVYTTPVLYDTTTYYVMAQAGSGTGNEITTTFADNNAQSGNMFDIISIAPITIDSFKVHASGAGTLEVYYKVGTYVGYNTNSSAWTLLGSQPIGNDEVIAGDLPSLNIPANTTYGLYITKTSGSLRYTNGLQPITTYTDGTVTLSLGIGVAYPYGSVFNPRVWNGTIYYSSGSGCASDLVPVTVNVQYAAYDADIWAVTSPVSGNYLTSSEPVTVNVYNNGLNPLINIPVHYTINGGTPVNETITGTLNPGQHVIYTFTTGANLSAFGTYEICVYTTYPNDGQLLNDTICITVTNSPIICIPTYSTGCSDGDQLTQFSLSNLNQTWIPCMGGYINYTNICIDIEQNLNYTISGEVGYPNQYVTIWVDFNDDFNYTSNEVVLTNWHFPAAGIIYTNTFTIPEYTAGGLYTAGTHRMRVVDVYASNPTNPCGNYSFGQTMDYCIIVIPAAAFTLDLEGTNLSCWGSGDGAVDLTITNISGVAPFTFLWSNNQTSEDITGLGVGTYTVTVTDSISNITTGSIYIAEPPQILLSAYGTDVTTLGGNNGSIDFWALGGVSPYNFLWAPGGETTEDISNLYGGIYQVTVTDASGCTATLSTTVNTPNPWAPNPAITNITHTINIPANANITLDGNPLPPGSWLGVFYHVGNTFVCGGATFWNNMTVNMIAYGNTGTDNGFDAGETFTWKVWVPSPAGVHPATATYDLSYPQNSTFLTNGYSGIMALAAVTVQYQIINLTSGWSIWSTYIYPFQTNIADVLSPICPLDPNPPNCPLPTSQVIIVKNQTGTVYWPQFCLNNIGDISIGQGYQIKTTQATSFTVTGLACYPEITPVSLGTGWYIIGYLRQTPGATIPMMSSLITSNNCPTGPMVTCISIMKDPAGTVFWPQFCLDGIGTMYPGKGYQLKMSCSGTLIYPQNNIATVSKEALINNPVWFTGVENTGNNMTLGIPESAWSVIPEIGDEIGVFNQNGELAGASVFQGGTTAIAVWGDDFTTGNNAEGLSIDEPFSIMLWHQNTGTEENFVVTHWTEGNEFFSTDGISVAGKITPQTTDYTLVQNNPNPFREKTNIRFHIPEDTHVTITLYNVLGDKMAEIVNGNYKAGEYNIVFNANGMASGTYFYKIVTSNFTATRKMNINK